MEDTVGIHDDICIRLITAEELARPRCGSCFARIGNFCATNGTIVHEYAPICDKYDKEIFIPI